MFEDIPLDTRHHVTKDKPKFPKEWRMTEERIKELQAIRAEGYLLEKAKKENNLLVDGKATITAALNPGGMPEKEPVMVERGQPKQGRFIPPIPQRP